jgi:hypothetical protein
MLKMFCENVLINQPIIVLDADFQNNYSCVL